MLEVAFVHYRAARLIKGWSQSALVALLHINKASSTITIIFVVVTLTIWKQEQLNRSRKYVFFVWWQTKFWGHPPIVLKEGVPVVIFLVITHNGFAGNSVTYFIPSFYVYQHLRFSAFLENSAPNLSFLYFLSGIMLVFLLVSQIERILAWRSTHTNPPIFTMYALCNRTASLITSAEFLLAFGLF